MNRLVALFEKHPDICTDTRQIRPGCLFFALKGEHFDGNMFASQALENGAAYAVVDQYHGTDPRCILVPDVLQALQQLAAVHRSRFAGPVLALSSTLAGNLLIVGSIANIIVVDQASRLGLSITWRDHAIVGVPVTMLTLAIAAVWLLALAWWWPCA